MSFVPIRYLITFMVFLAFSLDSAIRSAMSMTILAMARNTTKVEHSRHIAAQSPVANSATFAGLWSRVSSDSVNGSVLSAGVQTASEDSLHWDATIQSYVLFSVYGGIVLSQLPAGHFAESVSLKWVFGYGVFFMAALTLLTPVTAYWNVWVLIIIRFIAGLSVGVTFPCGNSLISRWSPTQERTLIITAALQGYSLGPILANMTTGPICDRLGWEYVFYLFGGLGIVWSLAWYFVVASSPEKHQWISEEEKIKIIEERQGNFDRNRHIPWRLILTSRPVLILSFRTLTINVFYAVWFTYLPSFFAHMYKTNLTTIGWIIGIANVISSIGALISSAWADHLLQSNYSINVVRKTFGTVSAVVPALMFIVMTQLEKSFTVVAIMVIVTCIAWGLYGGSDGALPIDLAPEYAGAISALQSVFANLALILVPLAVGRYLEKTEDFEHWNVIFFQSSFVTILGSVVFLIWGTAERQEWHSAPEVIDDERPFIDPL